jgi:hypothetical protein
MKRTRQEFLENQLCCLGSKCPCGGYWNDGSSHASDCLWLHGDKEYKWSPDEETPKKRNRKRIHEIRGKLSPVSHLIFCVKTQYDDDLSDDIGATSHKHIQDNMEENMKQAEIYLDKVLALLKKME